jgi:Ca-activated chloride channel family protein
VRDIPVEFPETMASHDVLASLWARARVDDLMGQDLRGAQSGSMRQDLKDTITQLGIEYRLMTQFTSFVAVEEMVVTDGGKPRRVDVPIEVPEGVKGQDKDTEGRSYVGFALTTASVSRSKARGSGGGFIGMRKTPAAPPNMPPTVNSVEVIDREAIELKQKLHPSIFAVVQKLQKKETLSNPAETPFIRDGKAEVQVWLTEKSDEALAQLKEVGFEVVLDAKSSKMIIGRLPVEKLEALAKLKSVKYVAPQVMK